MKKQNVWERLLTALAVVNESQTPGTIMGVNNVLDGLLGGDYSLLREKFGALRIEDKKEVVRGLQNAGVAITMVAFLFGGYEALAGVFPI